MAWSTKQLADLTGVTLRSIRHWHEVGLLPEPERRSNGYKEYTAHHLALALRIHRLAGLGFPLGDVASMLGSEEAGRASLQELREEIDGRVTDLVQLRSEIDELIGRGVSPDLSPEALGAFEALGGDPGSRNIAIVLTHLMPREDIHLLTGALQDAPDELNHANAEIQALPADAADEEIAALADSATASIRVFLASHRQVLLDVLDSPDRSTNPDVAVALSTLVEDGMNPAQRRTLRRIEENLDGSFE